MASVQVRYIVHDVDAAIAFYRAAWLHTRDASCSGFRHADTRRTPSRPQCTKPIGGGQPMPDGTSQKPGGWNRFAIEVYDLAATFEKLHKAGIHFRNNIVSGVGGKQVIVDDPFWKSDRTIRTDHS